MASHDDAKVEEEADAQFAPVHQLTDKDQIATKTHEENEDIKFKMRAKLFRFEMNTNEWKERGTGDVRILSHKETKKTRLVMRRDKTLKVCANHYITADMRLQPNIGSDRSWVWKVAADVSEGEPTADTLAIRFANADNAGQFKVAFEDAQRTNAELQTAAASAPAAAADPESATAADEPNPDADVDDLAAGVGKLDTEEKPEAETAAAAVAPEASEEADETPAAADADADEDVSKLTTTVGGLNTEETPAATTDAEDADAPEPEALTGVETVTGEGAKTEDDKVEGEHKKENSE